MAYEKPKVKTFTHVVRKVAKAGEPATTVKPEQTLDEQINGWVDETGSTITHTSVDAFTVTETIGDTLVRRVITTSQVVYVKQAAEEPKAEPTPATPEQPQLPEGKALAGLLAQGDEEFGSD